MKIIRKEPCVKCGGYEFYSDKHRKWCADCDIRRSKKLRDLKVYGTSFNNDLVNKRRLAEQKLEEIQLEIE